MEIERKFLIKELPDLSKYEYVDEAALTKESYEHLLEQIDGHAITKRRYLIPLEPYTIELDVFYGHMEGLIMAEVEFPSVEEANNFNPPSWFGVDVTEDRRYHNSNMIMGNPLK